MRLLFLILTVLLVGCSKKTETIILQPVNLTNSVLPDATGRKMSQVKIKTAVKGEFDDIDWTFSRKFSPEDILLSKLSVDFVERLTGLKYDVRYENFYWSDDMLPSMGTNQSLLGMTIFYEHRDAWRAYIAIASELKPKTVRDLNSLRDFGSTLAHESLHASNLDIEETVRAKIERPIDMTFDLYCSVTVSNFYGNINTDRFTNKPYVKMIEKVAFESGISPPWHYNRDYIGEKVRPIFLLVQPPTMNSIR